MVVQSTHHPVLILEASKFNQKYLWQYYNSNQKNLSSRYDSQQILGRSLYLDIYALRIVMFLSSWKKTFYFRQNYWLTNT